MRIQKWLVLAITLFSTTCLRAESRWLFGVSAGGGSAQVDNEQYIAFSQSALSLGYVEHRDVSTSIDQDQLVWSIATSYFLNENLSVGLEVLDVGRIDYRYSGQFRQVTLGPLPGPPGPWVSGETTTTVDTVVVGINLRGTIPLPHNLEVHGKIGLVRNFVDISLTTQVAGGPATPVDLADDSGDNFGMQLGVGVGYRFGERWRVALDLLRMQGGNTHSRVYPNGTEFNLGVDRNVASLSLEWKP
jgi:opacity protein-like surface antigen